MQTIKNIIIGFGKGGKTLAKFLAQKGEEVLVIEKSNKMYGGTCINIACLPSKRLIIEAANGVSYVDAVNGKNEMTAQLRDKNYHMLADEKSVTVLDGEAHFIADHEVEVILPNGEKAKYRGERIFINTGAVPVMLPIPGLKESKYVLNSTQAMDEKKMPENLTIIGAGYIGLEFASMFAKYGSKVTVLDHSKEFLSREDEDISQLVKKDLEDVGVHFELGADITEISDGENDAKVHYHVNGQEKEINADRILVATGRKPNIENLGLENTAIEVTDRGAIKVDDFLRTTVDNVWAIGDVKGGLQFTYISLDDFRIIKDQLFGTGARMISDRKVVPYSVFISPALSQVGLNEKQAQKQDKKYKLFKLPVAAIPKAKVAKDSRGLFKALVDPETEEILGATLYGIESYELINMISLAMKAHLSYTVLRDQIYTHPTMSEAFNDLFK
ncbi:pyridine nucleotide-disulfide oxidoreductase [Lactobacillus taiwanensis]|jgi:Pyruvate/2-oxoglutarate dehydrogenase complex, dihydrolipoamide dehydrogenase (E3) component, and related enzymes|uniref:FAD-containing oxidoreductase n=1 Tax=Lactobacillus taiwanensis TaxID=508451 RepID=UPI000B97EEBB|nr:FAD-containing oxidoreductase [Lactobacillus taiwanensis]OYS18689.1 pyridine nucleotide-disulfide oxidoreductase [Lactobacillus taiwanensis]OYS21373.1 pyridine nucleotide-disulfide oxidoreductase [Lactobacillus taiwanensis]OYS22306.1 pyridine nucleotide-disulfide oxidoreductase [Lactobacillus taiwanensis]OYS27372.1 pyridine nucleotide-disulfide oxidoreductase [Lactobacillus taiwanensis]OYS27393.1 pyridine nucleotide-disulfide oxidoreductase [Lactobacillus taiwanensis]